MRRYVVNGCILSKWTKQFLSYVDEFIAFYKAEHFDYIDLEVA